MKKGKDRAIIRMKGTPSKVSTHSRNKGRKEEIQYNILLNKSKTTILFPTTLTTVYYLFIITDIKIILSPPYLLLFSFLLYYRTARISSSSLSFSPYSSGRIIKRDVV